MSTGPKGPSVAAVVAHHLVTQGVPIAFGHPGGEVTLLIDALAREGVPFMLARHENEAAFMALGFGELTGKPGLCIATLGPGATNMVTGVASALLERAPLIALTGALAESAPAGTTHQALDLNAMYAPVVKRSIAVTEDNAEESIAGALRLATQTRPGPVHLSIPSDVASRPAKEAKPARAVKEAAPKTASNVESAIRCLRTAGRPALVIGPGALRDEAYDGVRRLAEALHAPVVTTPKAKGVFPEEHPLFAGTLEMAGDDLVVQLLGRADTLVAIGVDAVEFDKPWRLQAPLVHIDSIPNIDRYYAADIEVTGNVDHALTGIATDVSNSKWNAQDLADHRLTLRGYIRRDIGGLQPRDVVDEVRAALPEPTIATCDVGAHKMLVGQAWPAHAPRTFFMANGLSSMGYSVPVATVARLVHPEVPVVAFVGDGGLGMYLGELETLVRAKIGILIVTFVDGTLELIRRSQLRRQLPTTGTSFSNPDYRALGKALGFTALEVSTRSELKRALPRLLAVPGLTLLAAHINRDGYQF